MRMQPIGSRVGSNEGIPHAFTRADRRLGEMRHAVHIVAQPKSVPVQGRGLRQAVAHLDLQHVTYVAAHQWSGDLVVVGPGANHPATEVDLGFLRGQRRGDRTAGPPCAARLLRPRHRVRRRKHPPASGCVIGPQPQPRACGRPKPDYARPAEQHASARQRDVPNSTQPRSYLTRSKLENMESRPRKSSRALPSLSGMCSARLSAWRQRCPGCPRPLQRHRGQRAPGAGVRFT